MPIIITQIKGRLSEPEDSVISHALKMAGIFKSDTVKTAIYKTSLDARKQNDIHFVHSVYAELKEPESERIIGEKKFCKYIEKKEIAPQISEKKENGRVVIAGFGPAGMFCGLLLAENGYRPVILERGECIDKRVSSVNRFWKTGKLDLESNVQFGEGGAGTFSDGKLTTRINDPLCRYVLERFVQFGAPHEILTKAKPHIGTDKLRDIVKAIRMRIEELGGEVRFSTRLDDIEMKNHRAVCARASGQCVETAALVLALGHSARDTFEMLCRKNMLLQPKPFSVGVRIEHRQDDVDYSLYGKHKDNPMLPVGEYQLSHRNSDGRAVYTFCMCPGGTVVPAASEAGGVVTNGMSEFARCGENANAAIAISVSERDYGSGILDGVEFARKIERLAYSCGGGEYIAPACTVGGFLDGSPSVKTSLNPTYERGIVPCEFRNIFPPAVTGMLETGLRRFAGKMKCFNSRDGLMTAPETRTSSPVRIMRSDNMTALSYENVYPCGEGAGYAGGIMSAAVDGIKTALEIMKNIAP